jgi:hypothetical protein
MSLMLQRCIDPASVPVLVDLGSVDDRRSRDNAVTLIAAGVSRKNISIEGHRRLLIKLPPRKAAALLAQFPIVAGVTYWKCTHHWPLAKTV